MEERTRAGGAGRPVHPSRRSLSDCTSYEFELLEAEVRGETAYTVGLEHTSVSVNGVPRTYTLRATQIYRREDGAWKVAHRHGSAPPA